MHKNKVKTLSSCMVAVFLRPLPLRRRRKCHSTTIKQRTFVGFKGTRLAATDELEVNSNITLVKNEKK